MPETNKVGQPLPLSKRWIFGAIGAASIALLITAIQQWIHYDDAANRAAHYTRQAEQQMATDCITPGTRAKCAREIIEASRAKQRDEYDLYSQQSMALWTTVMGCMAVLGVMLSWIGVILIWRTWDATRDAAENSRKTLRSYIARERAIIVPSNDVTILDFESTLESGMLVKLKNAGLSFANIYQIEWQNVNKQIWPEKLLHSSFTNLVVLPDDTDWTPRMHCDFTQFGYDDQWFLLSVHYTTLEDEIYSTSVGFRVAFDRGSDTQGPVVRCIIDTIAGQPKNR